MGSSSAPTSSVKVDLPTKRRRKHPSLKADHPRRDNRRSRHDPSFTAVDERHNSSFEEYYRCQHIVPEQEFPLLLQTLATPLPSSFRVVANGAFRESIQGKLRGEMSQLFRNISKSSELSKDESPLKPLSQIPWYPGGLAWSVSAPRQMLRRDNVLSPFHKFLVSMNEIGAINRQEAASMIPPLLLDVHPGHSVIDLCAAPGSKTAQILESVCGHSQPLGSVGVVVANDADIKRCWMLAHQLKRFGSPQLIVTHHEAQQFPMIMSFDRVLCDVPCTGDGTLRKAPDIWRRWNSHIGIALHRLQRQITERGIDLLKPGGRLVYSTCSMNPVENEAVVAHILRKYDDDVELVDCSQQLPQLVRRKGLTTWLVKDNSEKEDELPMLSETGSDEKPETSLDKDAPPGNSKVKGWFRTFDEVPERRRVKTVRSLFPPSTEEMASGKFPLNRCMRIVPHDQDTGAFFVAVLQKKKSARLTRRQLREISSGDSTYPNPIDCHVDAQQDQNTDSKEERHNPKADESETKDASDKSKDAVRASRLITDDTLTTVKNVAPDTLKCIVDYFGMDHDVGENYLMTRGADGKSFKRVVGVSHTALTVIRHAIGSRDNVVEREKQVMRVVNAGVRVLERTDRKDTLCQFRLIQDGVGIMRLIMKSRVMTEGVDVDEVTRLLQLKTIKLEPEATPDCKRGFWQRVVDMGSGSAVLVCHDENIVVWVGKRSVGVVMPDEVITAMLMRFNDGCEGNSNSAQ